MAYKVTKWAYSGLERIDQWLAHSCEEHGRRSPWYYGFDGCDECGGCWTLVVSKGRRRDLHKT